MTTMKTWKTRGGWKLVADRTEVFPDDPGNGTPLLVVGPDGGTATLNCAIETGEIETRRDGYANIPDDVRDWLIKIEAEAEKWVYVNDPNFK